MKNKKCRCGCDDESTFIVRSFEFDPQQHDFKGNYFEEYCCLNSSLYLKDSAAELGFPCECVYIGDPALEYLR